MTVVKAERKLNSENWRQSRICRQADGIQKTPGYPGSESRFAAHCCGAINHRVSLLR